MISTSLPGHESNGLKKHRNRLNKKYSLLNIDIQDLKIERISNTRARVVFKQEYSADSYKDYGNKELIIDKKGKYWKIKEENWTPLKRKSRP